MAGILRDAKRNVQPDEPGTRARLSFDILRVFAID